MNTKNLSKVSKRLYRKILKEYDFDDQAAQKILIIALLALDRAEQARRIIENEGMIVFDRFKQPKAHPLLCVERDARAQFFQGMKTLRLDQSMGE